MPRPHVFRRGDSVTVVDPRVVVRVGYPLCLEAVIPRVEESRSREINAFMTQLGYGHSGDAFTDYSFDPRLYHELVEALARAEIRAKGFGGRERSIYTETDEQLRNTKGWTVLSKRTVKTGRYNPGSGGGYDDDPQPPYLDNERTHILLSLYHDWDGKNYETLDWPTIEIEAANVEPVANPL